MPHKDIHLLSIQASPDISAIRTAEFNGDEHIVVPMVILVEGVLHPANTPSPELALAEEFARHPQGWNGRPVVLGHPVRGGLPVSANTPSVLEDEAFGQLFNASIDETGKKLKAEAWINMTRVNELGDDVIQAVERLQQDGGMTEVSTGMFVTLESVEGIYQGNEFAGIWRNIVPDHLAILPEGVTGACSVEGGCGAPRLNGATSSPGWATGTFVERLNSGESLLSTYKGVKDAVKNNETPNNITANEDAPKVMCEACKTAEASQVGIFKQVFQFLSDKLSFKANSDILSDVDTRRALETALTAEDPDGFFWLVAVFTDHFVYESGFSATLLRRDFSVSEDGVVSLSADIQHVRPVTEFVLVQTDIETPEEEDAMTNAQRVQALIDNQATKFNEESREWLATLSEEQLDLMEPVEVVAANEVVESEVVEPEVVEPPNGVNGVSASEEAPSLEEYVSGAPPEIQEVLNQGLKMQADRRNSLISIIKGCDRNQFDDAVLKGFELSTLENLARLADAPTYNALSAGGVNGGSGTGSLRENSDNDNEVPAMPLVFPKAASQ